MVVTSSCCGSFATVSQSQNELLIKFLECDGECHKISVQNGKTKTLREHATNTDKNGLELVCPRCANERKRAGKGCKVRSVAIEIGNGPAKRFEATRELGNSSQQSKLEVGHCPPFSIEKI